MEHWLDTLAKRLASRRVSRRNLLAGALRTGAAAAGFSLLGLGAPDPVVLARAREVSGTKVTKQDVERGVTCAITPTGTTTVFAATITARGGRLVLNETVTADLPQLNQGSRNVTRNLTIALDGASLLRRTTTGTSTGSTANAYAVTSVTMAIHYGEGFSGVQDASFTSDGKTVQGTVNGRAIVPFPATAVEGLLWYPGGQPVPFLRVEPAILVAIDEIVAKTALEAPECFQAIDPDSCAQCQDNCFTSPVSSLQGLVSTAGQIAGCVASFGITCVVSAISAMSSLNDCENACFYPGGACCVVGCVSGTCCPQGYVCAVTALNISPEFLPDLPTCCETGVDSISDGFCCPAGYGYGISCHGYCCGTLEFCCKNGCCDHACTATDDLCCPSVYGQPVTSCSGQCCTDPNDVCSQEGVCCRPLPGGPTPPISCNGTCCPSAGDFCTDTGCCPAGSPVCDDGSCCPTSLGACINGTCCSSQLGQSPCGTICCDYPTPCLGGVCCAQAQQCGSVCCPSGQYCHDASTGTCATCPAGTSSVTCQNAVAGPATDACCGPGISCCNGACCPYASDQYGDVVCCSANQDVAPFITGGWGCHHVRYCVGPQ